MGYTAYPSPNPKPWQELEWLKNYEIKRNTFVIVYKNRIVELVCNSKEEGTHLEQIMDKQDVILVALNFEGTTYSVFDPNGVYFDRLYFY